MAKTAFVVTETIGQYDDREQHNVATFRVYEAALAHIEFLKVQNAEMIEWHTKLNAFLQEQNTTTRPAFKVGSKTYFDDLEKWVKDVLTPNYIQFFTNNGRDASKEEIDHEIYLYRSTEKAYYDCEEVPILG